MAKKKRKQTRLRFSPASRSKKSGGEGVRKVSTALAFTVLVSAVLAGLVMLGWGFKAVFLSRNTHFTLKKVSKVDIFTHEGEHGSATPGKGVVTEEDLIGYLEDLGIKAGESNLFAIDLKATARQVEKRNVLVREVGLSRVLPDRLEVKIYEPVPVARLRSDLLLDRDGLVLPPRLDAWTTSLPVLTGFKGAGSLQVGDSMSDPMLESALLLLSLTRTDPCGEFLEPHLIQPDYSNESLKVYPAALGPFREQAQVVVPADPDRMVSALAKVDTIVRERYRARQPISFIDATYERNIPVRP